MHTGCGKLRSCCGSALGSPMRLSFVRVTIGLPLQPDSFTHDWDRQDCDYQSLPHSVSRPSLCPRDAHARPSERLGHSKIGITLDLYSHVLPNM